MKRDRLSDDALSACLLLAGAFAALGLVSALELAVPDGFGGYGLPWGRTATFYGLLAAYVFGLVTAGAVALLLQFYWHPYRALGFVPPALVGWFVVALFGRAFGVWTWWLHGLFAGLAIGGILRFFRSLRLYHLGLPTLVAMSAGYGAYVGAVFGLLDQDEALRSVLHGTLGPTLLALLGLLTLVAWTRLFRPAYELAWELPLWWMYAVRSAGPGAAAMPPRGPCLILANHSCYLDPLFLGKVFPRPITAMMTAAFADYWLLRWLAITVYDIVRVPERTMKHDPTEIRDAIERLDRGEALVVFPEGYLRRSPDVPLRRFGRGIWQLLKARPDTPVYCVWIEGAWGSWMSHANGPPMRNKRRDFRRPIGVAVSAPLAVPAHVLENHFQTRLFLMNQVSAARTHLGLPAFPPFELPAKGDEEGA